MKDISMLGAIVTSKDLISVLALDIDGVLTDGRVLLDSSGKESKWISYHDIDAIFAARREGLKVVLVTAEDTPWVNFIAERLEIEDVITGAKNKESAIRELSRKFGIALAQICYVGDSDRDAAAIEVVGLGLAPANATTTAKSSANKILHHAGGAGAVNEAVKLIKDRNKDTF